MIVGIIVVNNYVTGMRKTVLTFRDAFGLYWYDRHKPIIESAINIISSIILANYLGVLGVFIGTFISSITTCLWIEPYILYKYGFGIKCNEYFRLYFKYTIITLIFGVITFIMCNSVFNCVGIISFIGKVIISTIIPNILLCIVFHNKDEYKYFKKIIISVKNSIINKLSKYRTE